MQSAILAVAVLAAGAAAQSTSTIIPLTTGPSTVSLASSSSTGSASWSWYNTTITAVTTVNELTTVCTEGATTWTFGGIEYPATQGETITVTNCPCTLSTVRVPPFFTPVVPVLVRLSVYLFVLCGVVRLGRENRRLTNTPLSNQQAQNIVTSTLCADTTTATGVAPAVQVATAAAAETTAAAADSTTAAAVVAPATTTSQTYVAASSPATASQSAVLVAGASSTRQSIVGLIVAALGVLAI
jgi:hypothetical protein